MALRRQPENNSQSRSAGWWALPGSQLLSRLSERARGPSLDADLEANLARSTERLPDHQHADGDDQVSSGQLSPISSAQQRPTRNVQWAQHTATLSLQRTRPLQPRRSADSDKTAFEPYGRPLVRHYWENMPSPNNPCNLTPLSLGIPEPKFDLAGPPPPTPGVLPLFALPGTPPEAGSSLPPSPCPEADIPPDHQTRCYQPNPDKFGDSYDSVSDILTYKLWQSMYQTILFRMPVFYYGRVSRVLEDADMSMAEVHKLARTTTAEWAAKGFEERKEALERLRRISNWTMVPQHASNWVTPAMERFRDSWESFIHSLLREWKTQNVISALLISALMSMLQIDAASSDVVTRTLCLLALIAALMSLLYGCLYIIRFGTMNRMHKAAAWADEAQKRRDYILWNVWVLLAMPTVWLIWSIILFISSIMSYVWRMGHVADDERGNYSGRPARIVISCMLGLGIVYLCLIINTFARYGDRMDRIYKQRVQAMVQQILPHGTTYSAYGVETTNKQVTETSLQTSTPASRTGSVTPEVLTRARDSDAERRAARARSFPSPGPKNRGTSRPATPYPLSPFLPSIAEDHSADGDAEEHRPTPSMQPESLPGQARTANMSEDSISSHVPISSETYVNGPVTTDIQGDSQAPPADTFPSHTPSPVTAESPLPRQNVSYQHEAPLDLLSGPLDEPSGPQEYREHLESPSHMPERLAPVRTRHAARADTESPLVYWRMAYEVTPALEFDTTGTFETIASFQQLSPSLRRSNAGLPQAADPGIAEGLASRSDVVDESPAVGEPSSTANAGRDGTLDNPEDGLSFDSSRRHHSSNPSHPLRRSMSGDAIWRPAEADIAPMNAGGQQTSERLPTLEKVDESLLSRRPASGPRVGFRRSRSMEW